MCSTTVNIDMNAIHPMKMIQPIHPSGLYKHTGASSLSHKWDLGILKGHSTSAPSIRGGNPKDVADLDDIVDKIPAPKTSLKVAVPEKDSPLTKKPCTMESASTPCGSKHKKTSSSEHQPRALELHSLPTQDRAGKEDFQGVRLSMNPDKCTTYLWAWGNKPPMSCILCTVLPPSTCRANHHA